MQFDTIKCYTCGVVFEREPQHKYVSTAECDVCFNKKQDEYYAEIKRKKAEEDSSIEEHYKEKEERNRLAGERPAWLDEYYKEKREKLMESK